MEQLIQELWNHISVMNAEMGNIEVSVAVLQAQMESILYWGRLGIGAAIVILITQLFQIIQIKKNGNGKK